ncbi:hypothetical protein [Enterovibrio paralichthyis]|uniref:hypothetical protein n=1 Tax=Enterovibrio paralichthyis TaxID=2853805 RepID=UPI0006D20688|nr:hypothetical protein [Enterovibrio paralichthyis]MBV7298541.1 hypothetical protein [Enterovibrio paralichthyis]
MDSLLAQLDQIDSDLMTLLSQEVVNSDEMAHLLNERKDCLVQITTLPVAPEKNAWTSAVARTEQILNLIKARRDGAAAHASRYIKGRKSVQIYKKFE